MAKILALPSERAELRLETVLKSVQANKHFRGNVRVETSRNTEEFFDDVVITCPLGWLKRNKQAISPLYPRVSDAIDSMSFGRLEKVSLQV